MTKLREAAQAVMTAETLNQMATALDALRDALAEPTEQMSDGYHTFAELYEFRKAYNAALFNEWAANVW